MTFSKGSRSTKSLGDARRLSLIALGTATAGAVLLAEATPLIGQYPEASHPIRIVIPEGMPVFDRNIADTHPGADPPSAIVFPHEPGAEASSLIMINPRHVDVRTLRAALSLLMLSLKAGQTDLIAVSDGMARAEGFRIESRLVAGELARLNAAPRIEIPRLGYGRMIMTERFSVKDGGEYP